MMLVRHKKPFFRGAALLAGFALMFYFLLAPVLPGEGGEKLTGLQYADQVFNELSKGSSYFIPSARGTSESMNGKMVSLDIAVASSSLKEVQEKLLARAGASRVSARSGRLSFAADLGRVLVQATEDADLLFHNDGAALEKKYGLPPLEIAAAWWHLLEPCIKALQKEKLNAEAAAVAAINRRAIEPGNNFYGIRAEKVADNIPLISAFLLFYVVYTIWYGFAIYEIFDGLGLMTAHAAAKEVESDERD